MWMLQIGMWVKYIGQYVLWDRDKITDFLHGLLLNNHRYDTVLLNNIHSIRDFLCSVVVIDGQFYPCSSGLFQWQQDGNRPAKQALVDMVN